jgi:hypothetical protein
MRTGVHTTRPYVPAGRPVVGICICCGARLQGHREAVRCAPCQAMEAWPAPAATLTEVSHGDNLLGPIYGPRQEHDQ